METVLVAGGTGVLGAPVVQRLASDGRHVRVLTRNVGSTPPPSGRVAYVPGDLENAESLRRALEGCAAVHISVRGGPTPDLYDRVEARGPAQLARLAAQAGVRRLTYVSHMLADEASPAPDLRAKGRAEAAIKASGVPYTIFRPTLFMDTLPRQIRGRRAVVLGRHPGPFHFLAAGDLAVMVSRALDTPRAAHQTLHVHGPDPHTIAEALTTYCAQAAPDTRVQTMPHGAGLHAAPRPAPRHAPPDAGAHPNRRAWRSHRRQHPARVSDDHPRPVVRQPLIPHPACPGAARPCSAGADLEHGGPATATASDQESRSESG